MRKRIRSLLGADSGSNATVDFDFDIDIAVTLGAGALMLAGMDPEPLVLPPSSNGDAVGNVKNGDGGIDDGRRKDSANEAGDGGEEEDGSDAQDGRGSIPELPRVAEEYSETESGNETRPAPQDQRQQQGEGAVLEGREAALLMEYLGAAAFTAAGKQRTTQAPLAPVAELSAAAGSNSARASFRRNGQGVKPTETKVRIVRIDGGGNEREAPVDFIPGRISLVWTPRIPTQPLRRLGFSPTTRVLR